MTTLNPKNLAYHELIGLNMKVISTKDNTFRGVKGKIIDETRNTFQIEISSRSRKKMIIPKNITTFSFQIPDGEEVFVNGQILVGKPRDRLKMRKRLW